MSATVARGATFTHDRLLDTTWRPGPGQRYTDAPKARMRVFRVTVDTGWSGYVDATRSSHRMDRAEFESRFSLDTAR